MTETSGSRNQEGPGSPAARPEPGPPVYRSRVRVLLGRPRTGAPMPLSARVLPPVGFVYGDPPPPGPFAGFPAFPPGPEETGTEALPEEAGTGRESGPGELMSHFTPRAERRPEAFIPAPKHPKAPDRGLALRGESRERSPAAAGLAGPSNEPERTASGSIPGRKRAGSPPGLSGKESPAEGSGKPERGREGSRLRPGPRGPLLTGKSEPRAEASPGLAEGKMPAFDFPPLVPRAFADTGENPGEEGRTAFPGATTPAAGAERADRAATGTDRAFPKPGPSGQGAWAGDPAQAGYRLEARGSAPIAAAPIERRGGRYDSSAPAGSGQAQNARGRPEEERHEGKDNSATGSEETLDRLTPLTELDIPGRTPKVRAMPLAARTCGLQEETELPEPPADRSERMGPAAPGAAFSAAPAPAAETGHGPSDPSPAGPALFEPAAGIERLRQAMQARAAAAPARLAEAGPEGRRTAPPAFPELRTVVLVRPSPGRPVGPAAFWARHGGGLSHLRPLR